MSRLRTFVILVALSATAAPVPGMAQASSDPDLVRRTEQLERQVADLQRRIERLDGLVSGAPAGSGGAPTSLANWRRLREGMGYSEVRQLLGEPVHISGGGLAIWRYGGNASVTFLSGRVQNWAEPSE